MRVDHVATYKPPKAKEGEEPTAEQILEERKRKNMILPPHLRDSDLEEGGREEHDEPSSSESESEKDKTELPPEIAEMDPEDPMKEYMIEEWKKRQAKLKRKAAKKQKKSKKKQKKSKDNEGYTNDRVERAYDHDEARISLVDEASALKERKRDASRVVPSNDEKHGRRSRSRSDHRQKYRNTSHSRDRHHSTSQHPDGNSSRRTQRQ